MTALLITDRPEESKRAEMPAQVSSPIRLRGRNLADLSQTLKMKKIGITPTQLERACKVSKAFHTNYKRIKDERSGFVNLSLKECKPKTQVFTQFNFKEDNSTVCHSYTRLSNSKSLPTGTTKNFEHAVAVAQSDTLPPTGLIVARLSPKLGKSEEADKQNIELFIKEANLLRMLQGPHICRMLDAARYKGYRRSKNFVMYQYLYQEMTDFMFTTPRPVINKALPNIFLGALKGLTWIHERNVIHCDLKIENLFIDEDGTCLIGDFGYANSKGGTLEVFSPTRWRAYARGEDYNGTVADDIWALGCAFIELRNHQPPSWFAYSSILKDLLMLKFDIAKKVMQEDLSNEEAKTESKAESKSSTRSLEAVFADLKKQFKLDVPGIVGKLDRLNQDEEVALQNTTKKMEALIKEAKAMIPQVKIDSADIEALNNLQVAANNMMERVWEHVEKSISAKDSSSDKEDHELTPDEYYLRMIKQMLKTKPLSAERLLNRFGGMLNSFRATYKKTS